MRRLIVTTFIVFIWAVAQSQTVHKCSQHTHLQELFKNAKFKSEFDLSQEQLRLEEQEAKSSLNKSGTIYTIPVVFHILHNDGAENISETQVIDAVRILNRDFRKQNSDTVSIDSNFQDIVADVEVEFVLATIAPNGDCFSGITRTKSSKTSVSGNVDGFDQVNEIEAKNDVYQGYWNPSKYLNIFVCKNIGGAAGYTFLPFGSANGDMYYNGIFMLSDYVGSVGTGSSFRSRTLTHEVGHWLNLPHTWGSTNEPEIQSNCNSDDGVGDTPNTIGVRWCNLSENSCGVIANVENYMDYSFCSKMFTLGQRSRMRAALTSAVAGRNNLWSPANLNEVGVNGSLAVCKSDFSTENSIVCSNSSVQFNDKSLHNPTNWEWSFPGGTPSTSTDQNPIIVYNSPGEYSVMLTVSDGVNSVSETKMGYITVIAETGISLVNEGFENINNLPSSDWFVNSSEENSSWYIASSAASSGGQSAYLLNSFNSDGGVNELLSTTINLDLNLSATISFDYAYARRQNSDNDRLKFYVSNDCGETWFLKKILSGSSLRTAPNTSGSFVPNDNEWKTTTVSSSSLANFLNSNFRMKFVFESGGGNNFYLDNINIEGPVSIDELPPVSNLMLYPNPVEDNLNISFYNSKIAYYNIKIIDVVGKTIAVINDAELTNGDQQFQINTEAYNSGVYFISINNNESKKSYKFVVK